MSKHELNPADLCQFTGSDEFFRHGINRKVVFTTGAKYVADKGGAYWLLDEIAIANMFEKKVQGEEFQVWKLKKTAGTNRAMLSCEDGNGHAVYMKEIPFTDFPLDEIAIWFANDTIFLPSEY